MHPPPPPYTDDTRHHDPPPAYDDLAFDSLGIELGIALEEDHNAENKSHVCTEDLMIWSSAIIVVSIFTIVAIFTSHN